MIPMIQKLDATVGSHEEKSRSAEAPLIYSVLVGPILPSYGHRISLFVDGSQYMSFGVFSRTRIRDMKHASKEMIHYKLF
jgi:hypothetical protein